MGRMKTRTEIIGDLTALRDEIREMFVDVAHWNRIHPEEPPLDPDPQGNMRPLLERLERHIVADPGHGPIAPFKPEGWPPS